MVSFIKTNDCELETDHNRPPNTCLCGHSRGRHITGIHGKPLGKCAAGGCKCEEFVDAVVVKAARKLADASAKYNRAFTSPIEIEEEVERLGRLWEVAVREYLDLIEPAGDGMGFYPGFPPGFDPKRAERGLAQLSPEEKAEHTATA